MRILAYMGHPAHFHLLKNAILNLQKKGHETLVLIQTKDILERLLKGAGIEYQNVLVERRKDHPVSIALSLLSKDWHMIKLAKKFKPDLLVGTSVEITHVGKFIGRPSVVVNEDDWDYIPRFANMGYPFASTILLPDNCRAGKWQHKVVNYRSYHELAYLHPNHFVPDKTIAQPLYGDRDRYYILRFVHLGGHHDEGKQGIHKELGLRIVNRLEEYGKVHITSERELEPEFEPYRISINPLDIHHAMYFADMYIGDSQSMAMEASVLGTPSIRFNDFAGDISVLEELEHTYHLAVGIRTAYPDKLFAKLEEYLTTPDIVPQFKQRRERLVKEKIDYAAFLTWFLENYPESERQMREKPELQNRFA
ncbi:MAG TPA: DUF354 domain-containing protein [Calditrichia bacterium]|nr:DUF354 domain-containing protein [Calditrichota bacterium]HQU71190.1 DUF354 domain-containing protein [Calditrichia bacterium]HQV30348.1 DUF354 domain-containing protein [Calditrichia bacterium]